MDAVDYVIIIMMLVLLGVLGFGLFTLLRGNNPRRSNNLMMLRVAVQAGIILLAALFLAKAG